VPTESDNSPAANGHATQIDAGLTAYSFSLDGTKRTYISAGVYSGVLKAERPFSITLDLDALG
jgi:hypothetical protein